MTRLETNFNKIKHIYDANTWYKHKLYSNYLLSKTNELVYNEKTAHISRGHKQKLGYISCTIFYQEKRLGRGFHRLLWEAFHNKIIPK